MRKVFRYGLFTLGVLAALFAAGIWYLSSKDVGAAYVAQTAKDLAREHFRADLSIEDISGNPVRGFFAESLTLSKNGVNIITVRDARVNLNLLSLLRGSPKIRSVTLKGASVSLEPLKTLSREEFTAPAGELPVSVIRFDDSVLLTKAGEFRFDDGVVSITSAEISVESRIGFRDVTAQAEAAFTFLEGNLHLEDLDLRIGDATVKLSGDLYPEIDAGGTLTDMDLSILSRFWPGIGQDAFTGFFSTNIKVSGVWPHVAARGEIAIDKGTIYGVSLAGVRSSWWYRGTKLWFEEISGLANGSHVSGTVGLIFGEGPPETHLDLRSSGVKLSSWEKTFPWLSMAGGTLETLEVDLRRRVGTFTGLVRFTAPSMDLFNQTLEKVDASLELHENGHVSAEAEGLWIDALVHGRGTIIPGKNSSYDFTVDVKDLALHKASRVFPTESLALQGNAAGTVRIFGAGRDVRYEGELWSEKIRIKDELVDSPRLKFLYDGTDLRLKDLSATWKGLPVKGSGSVSRLGTEKAAFDFSGSTDGVKASAFEGFVPGLAGGSLAGEISVSWKLSGPVGNPSLALELSSSELSGVFKATVSGLSASLSVPRPFEQETLTVNGTARAAAAGYGDFTLTDLTAAFSTTAGAINVDSLTAGFLSGTLEASGIINLAPQGETPAEIDLSGKLSGADLSAFSSGESPVSGKVTGSFTATGPLEHPDVSFEAAVPEFSVFGYMVRELNLAGSAVSGGVSIEQFSALIGDGTLSGEGMLSLEKDGSVAGFSITGTGLDLEYLTQELSGARKAELEGMLDVNLTGSFEEGAWSGTGEVFAETLSAYGFTLRNVYAPVRLEGKVIHIEKAKGDFYDGSLVATGSVTLGSSLWKFDAQASGFNIAGVLDDAFDFGGKITGTGELELSLEHGESRAMPLSGQGRFSAADGEISGFAAVQALTSAYGGTGIRYSRVDSSFALGGNMLSLLPGSRMTAPPKDPLYRYMSVAGTLGYATSLDLYCSGNVNVQALSTFFSALEGLLGSESLDPQRMLENMLGGFLGGISKKDFRDVSFEIDGSWEKPVITNLKVAVPEKRVDPIPSEGDPERKGDERKLEIEIPTGGTTGGGDSVGDQIRQQILEQIFNIDN